MALPSGLPLNSDLGQLLSSLGNDTLLSVPKVAVPFTTIQNRAQIYDLSKDLGVRMGVDRIQTQQIYQIQDEFGPNGEPVWGVTNDKFGQIRFVGANWSNLVGTSGPLPTASAGSSLNHYVEVSFYGTGLNWLNSVHSGSDFRASVDGGAEGSSLLPATMSTVIAARNYSPNIIIPVVKGLTLGFHTVKIRANNDVAGMTIYGFEVLNESSSIRVNTGTSWKDGQKRYNPTQSVFSYNSGFESGVLGTRGGRVAVYQKPDGSIAKAVQPTNNSQQNLTAADHSNEEIARVYHFREFGSGRTDDFSSSFTSSSRAFTLDDGTTTLIGSAALTTGGSNLPHIRATTGGFIQITFVGTGLDILTQLNDGTSRVSNVSVNATSIGTISNPSNEGARVMKIVSGLPYGTHVVRFSQNTNDTVFLQSFIVYQPKTPTIPSNCSMIGTYNILANYDSSGVTTTGVAGHSQLPQGSLFKSIVRENTYVGANWAFGSVDPTYASGIVVGTAANNNQPVSYTFFGTGFMLTLLASAGGTYDISVSIDGVLNATGVAKANASNLGGGSYRSTSTVSGEPCRIEFTGLALGVYTVTIQKTAGTGQWNYSGLHLITPIHSHKNNGPLMVQNTLSVGSCSVNRKAEIIDISNNQLVNKNISTASGLTANPSTTSTLPVPLTDMVTTHKNTSGRIKVSYSSPWSTTNSAPTFYIYIDGIQVSNLGTVGSNGTMSHTQNFSVSPGVHSIQLYWSTAAGTATAGGISRVMSVEEA